MQIHPKTLEAYNLLHEGCLALTRAELQGFRIDQEYCERAVTDLTSHIEEIENKFYASEFYKDWEKSRRGKTVNINSGKQLRDYLYGVKGIKCQTFTASGAGSTDEETLKLLNIPELNLLLDARKMKKIRDTYLGSFIREQVRGRIHPFFNLHTAVTFRSSSNSPNFQNIPIRDKEARNYTRNAIFARKGNQLMEVDYKGIEVSIAACYHKDPRMINYINTPTSDMHLDMAKQIFFLPKNGDKHDPEISLLRDATKNGFIFPQFYGDYWKGCAISLMKWGKLPDARWNGEEGVPIAGNPLSKHLMSNGIHSGKNFMEHIKKIEEDFWGRRFPVYHKWKIKQWRRYQNRGLIDLKTGFQCRGIMKKNDVINYPVQGAAFHCLLWSFIRLDKLIRERKLRTRLIGQVHDSIILDVYPPELHEIGLLVTDITCRQLKEHWNWIAIPLRIDADLADIDKSWAEMRAHELPSM